MTTTTLVFLVGALVVNILTYGGVSLAYFLDKRRVDPPKPSSAPAAAPGPAPARESRSRGVIGPTVTAHPGLGRSFVAVGDEARSITGEALTSSSGRS